MVYNLIKHVLPQFRFQGRFVEAAEVRSGNVNATFILTYQDGEETRFYTLQKLNTYVFKAPGRDVQHRRHHRSPAAQPPVRSSGCPPPGAGGDPHPEQRRHAP